ncbi:MAG: GNAT family N-acetyltransferase [Acidimicrobiia bacterium]|jgi:GNAT superfamily N-acetyltransferase
MVTNLAVEGIDALPTDIARLLEASRAEGYDFVERLVHDWEGGSNRFDRPGEVLVEVRASAQLVAVGGLNVDPYLADPAVGRIRHVYVLPSARRSGVGSLLVKALVEHARGRFSRVRLRIGTPRGGPFYEALGFHPTDEADATHEIDPGMWL